jgi:hypothetical protein
MHKTLPHTSLTLRGQPIGTRSETVCCVICHYRRPRTTDNCPACELAAQHPGLSAEQVYEMLHGGGHEATSALAKVETDALYWKGMAETLLVSENKLKQRIEGLNAEWQAATNARVREVEGLNRTITQAKRKIADLESLIEARDMLIDDLRNEVIRLKALLPKPPKVGDALIHRMSGQRCTVLAFTREGLPVIEFDDAEVGVIDDMSKFTPFS